MVQLGYMLWQCSQWISYNGERQHTWVL